MDGTSFNAVYKFVSKQFGDDPPPRLVLAVLTYLEGLGYDLICSGDAAASYASEGMAQGPARHRNLAGSHQQLDGDSLSRWYALDMVRDSDTQNIVDQMMVHVQITAGVAFVHCSRGMWSRPLGGKGETPAVPSEEFQRVDVAASGFDKYTSCSLDGDDMIELCVETYDDGVALQNVERLCATFGAFFCKGSARDTGKKARDLTCLTDTSNPRHPGGLDPREPDFGGGHGDVDDVERFRVGQSDLDPIDRRGVGRGLGPDGMMVGPHHPMFGRGRMEPPPGHEGHLPPGARWDPIAPPGMQGFFPGDFERRRARGHGGEDIHPDIMQPGRGGGAGGFDFQ